MGRQVDFMRTRRRIRVLAPGREHVNKAVMSTTTVRRSPVQERSQETVARVLAATAALLGRGVSIEAITTAQIAIEAGMSVGGLYRFFPDKQTIIDAIAVRHMELFQERIGAAIMADFPETPGTFLSIVIDAFVAYLDENPDFRTVAFGAPGGGRTISRATREDYAGNQVSGLMMEFISGAFDIEPTPELAFRLRLATEIGDRLMAFAFEQSDPDERKRVIVEAKALLSRYLFEDAGV
jgi:AcrR family transcriptional regulator